MIAFQTQNSPEPELLRAVMLPLVEEHRGDLRSWHFFWEPDLWLRLAWKEGVNVEAKNVAIRDSLQNIEWSWAFASYDVATDEVVSEEKIWPLVEQCFCTGSELAAAIPDSREERAFHWHRNAHTLANQLFGTWADEVQLCLFQARYRMKLLSFSRKNGEGRDVLKPMVARLEEILEGVDDVRLVERELLERWRREGRPDLAQMLALPDGFHRNPSKLG